MSKQKSQFFEIKDAAMIAKMLNVCCRHKLPLTLWLKNQTLKFETIALEVFPATSRLFVKYPEFLSENALTNALFEQKSQEILGSFQIDDVNFFFKTDFQGKQPQGIMLIGLPAQVFKLQRRANIRIPFARAVAPKLTVFSPDKNFDPQKPMKATDILAYRVIDLSAGGLAFAAKIEEQDLLKKNTILHDMRFKLKEHTIVVRGTIAHTVVTKSDKGGEILKVGVQFNGLKPADDRIINQFALEESRKMFSLLH